MWYLHGQNLSENLARGTSVWHSSQLYPCLLCELYPEVAEKQRLSQYSDKVSFV